MSPDPSVVEADMRRWLERAVIGLNLCPFAKSVYVKDQVHFVVTPSTQVADLMDDLRREIDALRALTPKQRDTTLLMAPEGFDDFLLFHDVAARAERAVRKMGLEGEIQVAWFHPDFQFAGVEPGDITNRTNQAPYPTLHILREASIERAAAAFPDAAAIYETNMEVMRRLGEEGWTALDVGRTK